MFYKSLLFVPALGLLMALPFVTAHAAEDKDKHPEIQGVIEMIPSHRQGVWKIAGRQITANAKTTFKEKKCPLKVGALAEVEYVMEGQALVAQEIKCETEIEIKGLVEAMPAGRLGAWKIGGQKVRADKQTQFDEKDCPIKVGSRIEAKVHMTPQGLVMKKAECETEDDEG